MNCTILIVLMHVVIVIVTLFWHPRLSIIKAKIIKSMFTDLYNNGMDD